MYRWWEHMDEDEDIKWHTLEHKGVLFPPTYVPHRVPLVYDGKPIVLDADSEEVASFFAAVVDSQYGKNPVFQKNFFRDFLVVLKAGRKAAKVSGTALPADTSVIESFDKCDFSKIAAYLVEQKELKKNKTKEDRAREKEAKKATEDVYGWAILDGRKEKVGNFRIEPPGLFRGRGEHPRTGSLKVTNRKKYDEKCPSLTLSSFFFFGWLAARTPGAGDD